MSAGRGTKNSTIESSSESSSIEVLEQIPLRRELAQLWTSVHGRPWSWIAVVPADSDLSAVPLARAVRDVWNWVAEFAVRLRIAENLDLAASAALVHQLRHGDGRRETAGSTTVPGVVLNIVAVESPIKNPLVLPIILGADAVILCAERGSTRVSAVRRTVEMIGRDHILACVLLS